MDIMTSTGLPNLLVAWLPILLPLIFLVLLRMPAKKGMTISAIIVVVFAIIHWGMSETIIFASFLKGTWQAGTILLILLGAMTLLNTLKHTGAVKRINSGFANLSKDMRVQAILLGFLFVSLLEGAAGFGSPAAVVGPLLLLLGFKPISAATIALLGDTVAVSFGAVDTPISVGLGELVANSNGVLDILKITQAVVFMDLLVASFLPLMMIFVLTQMLVKKQDRDIKDFIQMIPWALLIGFTYTLTALGVAFMLEDGAFISIFTPIFTMVIAVLTIKYNILVPKQEWRKASGEKGKPKALTAAQKKAAAAKLDKEMNLITAWSPYLVVVGLLVLTRLVPADVQASIKSFFDLSFTNILGTGGTEEDAIRSIGQGFQVLWNPGVVLLLAALFASLVQTKKITSFKKAIKEGTDQTKRSALTLTAILTMVAVFSYSDINSTGLPAMPKMIADELSVFGSQYFIIAPFISSLGSFIAGSATVSNLTFGGVHASAASNASINGNIILAQGTSGAAIGNCYCISNVVAASSVVGEQGSEGAIIAKTLPVALVMGALSAIAGGILIALGMFA